MVGELTCPECAWVISGFKHRAGEERQGGPADGDVVICFGCRGRAVFEGGSLRSETPDERERHLSMPELVAAQCEVMFRDEPAIGVARVRPPVPVRPRDAVARSWSPPRWARRLAAGFAFVMTVGTLGVVAVGVGAAFGLRWFW